MEYKPVSKTAVDEAVSRLRAEILARDYGVGCLPYREDMARRYGTSVYVVDQAIRRLLDEGLVSLKNKRVFVAGTSWQATIQASRIALDKLRFENHRVFSVPFAPEEVCSFVFSHQPFSPGGLVCLYHAPGHDTGKEQVNSAIPSY